MTTGDSAENYRRIVENKYKKALLRVVRDIKQLTQGITSPAAIIQAVQNYANSKSFVDFTTAAISRMVTATARGQKATWRQAATESTRGREIFLALRDETVGTALGAAINDIIARNSQLIKTIPRNVARQMSRMAYQSWAKGLRPQELAEAMAKKAPGLTKTQVMRIARTETAKAATALNQARCEQFGIDWYIWYSCQDERVRSSHNGMHGVYCRWSDPPAPEVLFPSSTNKPAGSYHPGGIYNCRCIALPVIDEKDIKFPCKVHIRGKIRSVNNLTQLHKLAL